MTDDADVDALLQRLVDLDNLADVFATPCTESCTIPTTESLFPEVTIFGEVVNKPKRKHDTRNDQDNEPDQSSIILGSNQYVDQTMRTSSTPQPSTRIFSLDESAASPATTPQRTPGACVSSSHSNTNANNKESASNAKAHRQRNNFDNAKISALM
jgi:hypothetical protein